MNWTVILILSLPAIFLGALSLKGLTQNKELFLWLTLGVLCIAYVYFFEDSHPFFHIFLIGLLWGILNSAVQASFYSVYIAHNPKAAKSYGKIAKTMNARFVMVLIGIGTGIGIGIALGAVSWIIDKTL